MDRNTTPAAPGASESLLRDHLVIHKDMVLYYVLILSFMMGLSLLMQIAVFKA